MRIIFSKSKNHGGHWKVDEDTMAQIIFEVMSLEPTNIWAKTTIEAFFHIKYITFHPEVFDLS